MGRNSSWTGSGPFFEADSAVAIHVTQLSRIGHKVRSKLA